MPGVRECRPDRVDHERPRRDGVLRVLAHMDPGGGVVILDRAAVDAALRQVIGHLDYDLAKGLECDEETGEDTYSVHVDRFVEEYGKVAGE